MKHFVISMYTMSWCTFRFPGVLRRHQPRKQAKSLAPWVRQRCTKLFREEAETAEVAASSLRFWNQNSNRFYNKLVLCWLKLYLDKYLIIIWI